MDPNPPSPEEALARTRAWVDHAVIGLNLCPFAKAVQAKAQVRYVWCEATDTDALLDTLVQELQRLHDADAQVVDTTLIVHPFVLGDFLDYNDFLDVADAALRGLRLDGELQIASFHPHYQFAGTAPEDIENASNRSPYPTLHLLREASVERAVKAFPQAADIYETNIETLKKIGPRGWAEIQERIEAAARRRG
jgi:hypothetical protein